VHPREMMPVTKSQPAVRGAAGSTSALGLAYPPSNNLLLLQSVTGLLAVALVLYCMRWLSTVVPTHEAEHTDHDEL
jgi:hypothetical protein